MPLTYDPPSGSYTQAIPPGTRSFRNVVAAEFGYMRVEIIRDQSRCAGQKSTHCECRGIDFFTTDVVKGRKLFDWCVTHAEELGIQAVIFNNRQWGFGKWYERGDPSSPHTDHVHAEFTKHAATSLTEAKVRTALGQEDDVTSEQDARLRKVEANVGLIVALIAQGTSIDPLPASVLAMTYQIKEQLGQGGSGGAMTPAQIQANVKQAVRELLAERMKP